MKILTIVPQIPPSINGVGDYSLILAKQMFEQFGIETHFIVGDPSCKIELDVFGISAEVLADASERSLLLSLNKFPNDSIVLLQFSGYGYAKWACPHWLVSALKKWKNQNSQGKLLTMFHELYNVMGKPWQHNFWVSNIQKRIASQLSILSDQCFTTTQEYSETLCHLSHGKHQNVLVLSVFSTIGESLVLTELSTRKNRLVIFGQKGTRLHAYVRSLPMLQKACKTLGVEEIWDVGDPVDIDFSKIDMLPPIVQVGKCEPETIREILSNSLAGFLDYDVYRFSKSSILAAYCAHGLLAVTHCESPEPRDGLISGYHYWSANKPWAGKYSLDSAQRIARNGLHWYTSHSIARHATVFSGAIKASLVQCD